MSGCAIIQSVVKRFKEVGAARNESVYDGDITKHRSKLHQIISTKGI